MSLHLPARQAAMAARASIAKPAPQLRYLLPRTQRRNASWFSGFKWPGKRSKPDDETSSPFARELTKREKEVKMAARLGNRTEGATIFDEEIKGTGARDAEPGTALAPEAARRRQLSPLSYSRMKEHMERALNPDPRWKVRYQRKKVMQMVRADGKLSKKERIKLTEREHTSDSGVVPTSTKKLVHLSHQIVGKTVDEAITQMRFSKKKFAREVKYQLEEARNGAVVSRGMGLGVRAGETFAKRKIKTKDGRAIEVEDPTRLYVDQSWVTKGPDRGFRMHYAARGRQFTMWRPSARIYVVLKEEKTRIRQHDDRVAKEAKKAPWVHLPNRPVTAQRPYYSW
ncbi:ribosomal protein L22/L17 [Nemania sp. NC0429]|nr:ribosomal protein L22/L17 [Nemania sp. NC0429]